MLRLAVLLFEDFSSGSVAVLEWLMFVADTRQAQKESHFLSPKFDFVFLTLYNEF